MRHQLKQAAEREAAQKLERTLSRGFGMGR